MRDHKLVKLTSEGCVLPYYTSQHGTTFRNAPKIPIVYWPSGTLCIPVSAWLLDRYRSGHHATSRSRTGSSVITGAYLISAFVRYVASINKDFGSLTDDDIFDWSFQLRAAREVGSPELPLRSTTQIGRLMRSALSFLKWYQDYFMSDRTLIGTDSSNQIQISVKRGQTAHGHGYSYLHHRAIPKNSAQASVKPIGYSQITQLYEAVNRYTDSAYVKERIYQTLRLLEATGARRLEVALVTVDDIREAQKTGLLTVRSAKRSDAKTRQVPIAKAWLDSIVHFIEGPRDRLVRDLKRLGQLTTNPGELLLGIHGEGISEGTITKEVNSLARLAGIESKICPHMFRHRFITIQVAIRLREYAGRRLPIDVAHTILVKVAELSGHRDPQSLMVYIHLGYDELKIWDTSVSVTKFRSESEGLLRQLQTLVLAYDKANSMDALNKGIEILKSAAALNSAPTKG